MRNTKAALLGAASLLALLTGVAYAQNGAATRMVEVPEGAVVLLVPQAVFAGPVEALPSPFAMMRQMDAMMAQARAMAGGMTPMTDRTIEAALRDGGVSGVMVTSFSDGRNSCTRRVTYGAGAAAPQVEVVSATGSGCGGAGIPAGMPGEQPKFHTPSRAVARTLEARARTQAAPFQVASVR